jgi:hypothetical protein
LPGTSRADSDQAQIQAIAKQLVDAANVELAGRVGRPELPAPLKWAAAIIAGIMTVGSAGLLFWMVSTISQTQITVMEIKTRQQMTAEQWESRFKTLESRMVTIEEHVRERP